MKTRYTADALIDWGEPDGGGGVDIDTAKYKTFYGDDLEKVIKAAEKASLTGEAYLVTEERYRAQYGDWEVVDFISPYG